MLKGVYNAAKLSMRSIYKKKVELLGNISIKEMCKCAADKQSSPLGKKPTVR